MASPFDDLDLRGAQEWLRRETNPDAEEAIAMYRGDHWLDSRGWLGQLPLPNQPGANEIIAHIRRGFTSENVIREVTNRHLSGVLGREPRWSYSLIRPVTDETPIVPEEQLLVDEADAAETDHWDEREPQQVLYDATAAALLAGRAVLRLYVPSGLRNPDTGAVAADTLGGGLRVAHLDAPDPSVAAVVTDARTGAQCGIFLYSEGKYGKQFAELTYIDDETNETVLRVVTRGGEAFDAQRYELGGRLLMYELRRPPLIDRPILQMQKQLNLALTQAGRNVNLAGSLERYIFNAQKPGEYVDAAGNPWIDGQSVGEKRWVAGSYGTGPGVTNVVVGLPIRDEDKRITGYTNPNISFRDPTRPASFKETRDLYYAGILGGTDQRHMLMTADGDASGEARKLARQEFTISLTPTARQVANAGRWYLEAHVALGALIAGTPNRYLPLRAVFVPHIDTGPISAADQEQARENYKEGIIALPSAQELVGREDTDAEMQLLEEDAQRRRDAADADSRTALARDRAEEDAAIAARLLRQRPPADDE